jgi:Tfp pilus assembly protein PilX
MILVTTLVIMLLVVILGAGVLFATRVELGSSSNYHQSKKAFHHADAVMQLALRSAAVLTNGTMEDVRDHLDYNSSHTGYKIEVNDDLAYLLTDVSKKRVSLKERYLAVGRTDNPDIVVKDTQNRVVGTVMISRDLAHDSASGAPSGVGSAEGVNINGSNTVGSLGTRYFVITVSGKDPEGGGGQNFFNVSDDEAKSSGPQTFITVLYAVDQVL